MESFGLQHSLRQHHRDATRDRWQICSFGFVATLDNLSYFDMPSFFCSSLSFLGIFKIGSSSDCLSSWETTHATRLEFCALL